MRNNSVEIAVQVADQRHLGSDRLPSVTVIVPHFRDLRALDQCLGALGRQTYAADQFDIVVADNASPEGEQAVTATIGGRARLVIVPERGAGPARNGGVTLARGEVLAFTDCDCQPEPEWLSEGVAALADYDLLGGQMKVLVDNPAQPTPAEAFELEFAFNNEAYVLTKGFSVTANLFCRRTVFEAVGGFRVGVSEDFEWCHRATGAGYRLGYAASAIVGHPARKTWSELLAKWKRMNVETYGLYGDRWWGRARWLLRSLLLPLSAIAHTPRVIMSRKLSGVGQKADALKVLYRLRFWRCFDSLRLLSTERAG